MIFLLLRLIIGFAAGYWIYSDARKRGIEKNTASLWSGGAVVLSVIATQFIVVLIAGYLVCRGKLKTVSRREENIIDIEATVVEETLSCAMCGGKIKEGFKVCPYCGFTLQFRCANCGQELSCDCKLCPNCHNPVALK
jgi:hypothetical protein